MKRARNDETHSSSSQGTGTSRLNTAAEGPDAGFTFILCGVSVTLTSQHFRAVRYLNTDTTGTMSKDKSDAPASYLGDGETAATAPSIALNVDVVFRAARLSGIRVLVLRCTHREPIALLPDPHTKHVTILRGMSYALGAFVGGAFHRLDCMMPSVNMGDEFTTRLGRALDGFLRFVAHPTAYTNLVAPMDLLRMRVAGALRHHRSELEGQGVHAASLLHPMVASWVALSDHERAQHLAMDDGAMDAGVHHAKVPVATATRAKQHNGSSGVPQDDRH